MTQRWMGAVGAVVEVGEAVAELRQKLEQGIRLDRLAAQVEADFFAHGRLLELLGVLDPGVPVVSEEDRAHPEDRPDVYWLIDPIDGTASWSGGFDGFVCQLARIEQNVVTFGAIHAPALDLTWHATRGAGAFLNGERMPMLDGLARKDESLVVVDNYPEPRGVCQDLLEWLGDAIYRESGSIGLKAALVASGQADLFVKDVVVRDWDVAPALVLLEEVGGFGTLATGEPYPLSGSYEKRQGVIFARDEGIGNSVLGWFATRD